MFRLLLFQIAFVNGHRTSSIKFSLTLRVHVHYLLYASPGIIPLISYKLISLMWPKPPISHELFIAAVNTLHSVVVWCRGRNNCIS